MRQALIDSIGHSTQDGYPKGSIIVCVSCGKPIYRLERGIGIGEGLGRARDAFVPVTPADIDYIVSRSDLDPGVRAHVREIQDVRQYCDAIARPTAGTPATCPKCDQVFIQTRTGEQSDTIDRGFVWEPTYIPPVGAAPMALRGGDLWAPR